MFDPAIKKDKTLKPVIFLEVITQLIFWQQSLLHTPQTYIKKLHTPQTYLKKLHTPQTYLKKLHLQVKLAVNCFILVSNQFEGMTSIPIHVAVAVRYSSVAKQERHLVKTLRSKTNEIPEHICILSDSKTRIDLVYTNALYITANEVYFRSIRVCD